MKNLSQQQTLGMKANLIKYLNPSTMIQHKAQRTRSQLSNMHCRSMQELDLNLNGVLQSSKENIKSNAHHSSLYNDKQNGNKADTSQNKSRSLSKFITFFQNSSLMGQVRKQTNENKKKNYNGFNYDLKLTGNSTVGGNSKKIMKKKDKENINYQTLTNQRQLNYVSQTRSPITTKTQTNNVPDEIQKIYRLRETIQQYKQRESIYNEKISQMQRRQHQLCQRLEKLEKQKQSTDKRLAQYESKIKQLSMKNKQTIEKYRSKQHKGSNKQSRQQSMVIKSLKKVINQQLNKIIQLERFKIENQYLREKLGNDESFSQSSFSNHDYSFQYDTQKEKHKDQSMTSTIRSNSDGQFGKEVFKKTKPMRDEINKALQKQNNQHSSRHFKSFFQVQQSPISESDGNIMNLFKPYESRKKNNQSKNDQNRQQTDMIKICEPQSSFTRQAIEQVNEENYDHQFSERNGSSSGANDFKQQVDSELRSENDSILQEVDEYLTKWRNHQG